MNLPASARNLFAVLTLCCTAASAHEVKEMTARARVFGDRVEMVITVSTHMATVLLTQPQGPPVDLSPETLSTFRARLEEQARAFCTVRSGDQVLQVSSLVDVVMTTPDELSFFFSYSAPAGRSIRFELGVMERLDPGYQVTIEVLDSKRKPLGAKPLTRGDSALEISLDEKAATPEPVSPVKP